MTNITRLSNFMPLKYVLPLVYDQSIFIQKFYQKKDIYLPLHHQKEKNMEMAKDRSADITHFARAKISVKSPLKNEHILKQKK